MTSPLRARFVGPLSRHVALASALLLAACGDGRGTDPRLSEPARLDFGLLTVASAGTAVNVAVAYRRTTGPTDFELYNSKFDLTPATTELPVYVDIAPCLADPQREASLTGLNGFCVLHVIIKLLDANGAVLDSSVLAPLAAAPGASSRAPETSLGLRVGSVVAVPQQDTLNAIGFGLLMSATVKDTRGLDMPDRKATFTALDTGLVSVDSFGVVRAKAVGLARVELAADGKSDTALILVRQLPASLSVTARAGELAFGDTMALVAVARDSNRVDIPQSVLPATYTSSATAVATVTTTGLVTAAGVGTARVTVAAGGLSSSVSVLVEPPQSPQDLALGAFHSCRLTHADGSLACWGSNHFGQFGLGNDAQYTTPGLVGNGSTFSTVSGAATGQSFCALDAGGALSCWGADAAGDLYSGSFTMRVQPTTIPGMPALTQVSVGSLLDGRQWTCGVTSIGEGYCWGDNTQGQLGDGTTISRTTPALVAGGHTWSKIVAGAGGFTCGLTTTGNTLCWGDNTDGALGDGTTTAHATPDTVQGAQYFIDIFAGASIACGISDAGVAYCWGNGDAGQLGNGLTGMSLTPTAIGDTLRFSTLALGFKHSCGIAYNGGTYCWGAANVGQLGDGTTTESPTPVRVSAGGFVSLVAGLAHTCALDQGGIAYCWGANFNGQLGDGSTTNRTSPVPVGGGHYFSHLAVGGGASCGIDDVGKPYCWGVGYTGVTASYATSPVAAYSGLALNAVTSGIQFICGLTTSGTASCAGDNSQGSLGETSGFWLASPGDVIGGLGFTSIGAASNSVCGVTPEAMAFCWGANEFSQLGDGTTISRPAPSTVSGGVSFRRIIASLTSACGLATDGAVYCWGANGVGQLGTGTTGPNATPVRVSGGNTYGAIAVGPRFACALANGGDAYCWGANTHGQLGDGTNIDRNVPTLVSGGQKFVTIVAGGAHACGLTGSGVAYCWGANFGGQLGDDSNTRSNVPVAVSTAEAFTAIAAGAAHTCGVTTSGATLCWGWNNSGQLGDGTLADKALPTAVLP